MRKIILHAPALDRHGNYRDAGSELTVGAEDNDDADISTARADELIESRCAVSVAVAAAESKAEPLAPEPSAPTRKPKA